MVTQSKPLQSSERRLSLHFGSLDALISYLSKHHAQEICVKAVGSPTFTLQGDSVRHAGVCVSACLSGQPGMPIAYSTFLAATGAWGGKHSRLLYPKLTAPDPLLSLPVHEVIGHLQQELISLLQQSLQSLPSSSLVLDAQWDVGDVWVGVAKGYHWQDGAWHRQQPSCSTPFSIL